MDPSAYAKVWQSNRKFWLSVASRTLMHENVAVGSVAKSFSGEAVRAFTLIPASLPPSYTPPKCHPIGRGVAGSIGRPPSFASVLDQHPPRLYVDRSTTSLILEPVPEISTGR
jgi:hypothetical protein